MACNIVFVVALVCLAALTIPGHVDGSNPRPEPMKQAPITNSCMKCICEASGTCNHKVLSKCSGGSCGIYGITWRYWIDAGSPTITHNEDPEGYQRCANDLQCSKLTVVNYLTKFAQDCNNDKVIDCHDYAAIHHLGGYRCTHALPRGYIKRFLDCQSKN